MAKLKRGALMHFLKLGESWYLIGKDIDDMSVDMNGTFETTKNILDETSVTDEGYEPSISVDPYYADPSDAIYQKISDLAMNRKSGDDAKGQYLEVIVTDTSSQSHKAWQEDCKVEISSYGGGTQGVNFQYVIHPDGNRQEGTAKLAGKVPTFTAGGSLS